MKKDIFIREGEREKYLKVKKKWKCNISIGYNIFFTIFGITYVCTKRTKKEKEMNLKCFVVNVTYNISK